MVNSEQWMERNGAAQWMSTHLRSLHTESEMFACVFPYSLSFPIKLHAIDAKHRKSNLIRMFFWRMKVLEAVCKHDWHNKRWYLFFNVRNFGRKCRTHLQRPLQSTAVFCWCSGVRKACVLPVDSLHLFLLCLRPVSPQNSFQRLY